MAVPETNLFREAQVIIDKLLAEAGDCIDSLSTDDLEVASETLKMHADDFDNGTLYTLSDDAVMSAPVGDL